MASKQDTAIMKANGESRNVNRAPYSQNEPGSSIPQGTGTSGIRRVFFRGLAKGTTNDALTKHIKNFTGFGVKQVEVFSKRHGSSKKGRAVAEFYTAEQAQVAIQKLNGTEIMGEAIEVREDRGEHTGQATTFSRHRNVSNNQFIRRHETSDNRIFVRNLAFTTKWKHLFDHCNEHSSGVVKYADIIQDKNGASKGCGIVTFETNEQATRAIGELDNTKLAGRAIFVRKDDRKLNTKPNVQQSSNNYDAENKLNGRQNGVQISKTDKGAKEGAALEELDDKKPSAPKASKEGAIADESNQKPSTEPTPDVTERPVHYEDKENNAPTSTTVTAKRTRENISSSPSSSPSYKKPRIGTHGQEQRRVQALEEDIEKCKKIVAKERENSTAMEKRMNQMAEKLMLAEKEARQLEEDLNEHKQNSISLEEAKEQRKDLERELENRDKKLQATIEDRDKLERQAETQLAKLVESERIRRELHNTVMKLKGNVIVYVRFRPDVYQSATLPHDANQRKPPSKTAACQKMAQEQEESDEIVCYPGVAYSADAGQSFVKLIEPQKDKGGLSHRRKTHEFAFDNIFPPEQGQQEVWDKTEPFVQSAIDGYNVCLFAYGQTGSGKTHTILGEAGNEGIISRANRKLFDAKQHMEEENPGTIVNISVEVLELYNETVCDLLDPSRTEKGGKAKLKVMANKEVDNIRLAASSEGDVMHALELAQQRRCVKATNSNSQSSRSHLLFTIHFKVFTIADSAGMKKLGRSGKLLVCDLAGNERLEKSGANNDVWSDLTTETKNINSSLSVLSRVIEELQKGSTCVPYRESKLTLLLKDSLGGNSKTLAIICCNSSPLHYNETLSSLNFAKRAAKVELKALSNVTV